MIERLSPIVLALLLTGCGAAMPGYSPGGNSASSMPSNEIGRMEGAAYVMSSSERALDCKHLTGSMLITIARLKDRNQAAQPSATSTGLKKTIAPMFGGSTFNTDPESETAREKAKLQAYNRYLGEKGCNKLDIEAELAKPPEGPRKY